MATVEIFPASIGRNDNLTGFRMQITLPPTNDGRTRPISQRTALTMNLLNQLECARAIVCAVRGLVSPYGVARVHCAHSASLAALVAQTYAADDDD